MAVTDKDGYTLNEPRGITVLFDFWNDMDSIMNEITATGFIDTAYMTAHSGDTDAQKKTDPMFHGGLTSLFQQTMVMGYADQVTGANLNLLSEKLRGEIVQQIQGGGVVSSLAREQALSGYSLFLNPLGDFSAQLASRLSTGGFETNPNGDILRLKFVTRGNSIKFTVNIDVMQLVDPISVFTGGGPSFSVYFDTVTTVDVQLPHRSADGFRLISGSIQNVGATVHPENLDAFLVFPAVLVPITNGVNGSQKDLTAQLLPGIQSLTGLLANDRFDQADYVNRGDQLQMKATQHPFRDFLLTIDYVEELFPGRVEPHIETFVLPGIAQELPLDRFPALHGNHPVSKHFADGTRYVIMEIRISRQFIHNLVGGKLLTFGDQTFIYYDDGTIEDLGANFNPKDPASAELLRGLIPKHNPTPPGPTGVVRVLDLYLDYTLASVIGRYNGISLFRGQSGQQIRVPGDKIIPEVWFTVTMSGTRNSPIPNLEPPIPPRPGQTALYVGRR